MAFPGWVGSVPLQNAGTWDIPKKNPYQKISNKQISKNTSTKDCLKKIVHQRMSEEKSLPKKIPEETFSTMKRHSIGFFEETSLPKIGEKSIPKKLKRNLYQKTKEIDISTKKNQEKFQQKYLSRDLVYQNNLMHIYQQMFEETN